MDTQVHNDIVVISCNSYDKNISMKSIPLKPHFYIVKLGFTGVNLFFLYLNQNIDCIYRRF